MAQIATQHVNLAGAAPTYAAAASGDTAAVGSGDTKLIVKNGAMASITVSIAVPGVQQNGVANDPTVYTVPATTGEKWIPLYAFYADPTDGLAHITYSALTTVTRAVVKG